MIDEENRYIDLLEEQRLAERAETAAQGGDATVNHIH